MVYTRRQTTNGNRNIMLTYSLDAGQTFSPVSVVFNSDADERTPRIEYLPEQDRFAVFFLSGSAAGDSGAVFYCEGSLATPWVTSDTVRISGTDQVKLSGGLTTTTSANGVAVSWCASFPTGDTDIRFDASWRGEQVSMPHLIAPQEFSLGLSFPNPFNSTTSLPVSISQSGFVRVDVFDILGRNIWTANQMLSAGEHVLTVNLANQSSGPYLAQVEYHNQVQRTKLVFIK
jgi:hypothetical protein